MRINKLLIGWSIRVLLSSRVYEVIRTISSLFIFFYQKNLVSKEQLTGINILKNQVKFKTDILMFLIDSGFQGVNRPFVLSFESHNNVIFQLSK